MDVVHFLSEIFESGDYFVDLFGIDVSLFRIRLSLKFFNLSLDLSNILVKITHLLFKFIFDLNSLVSQVLFGVLDEEDYSVDCRVSLLNRLIILLIQFVLWILIEEHEPLYHICVLVHKPILLTEFHLLEFSLEIYE